MTANETLNEQIKALKDTYMDMISVCDIEIKRGDEDFYWADLKNRIKIKILELEILLTK